MRLEVFEVIFDNSFDKIDSFKSELMFALKTVNNVNSMFHITVKDKDELDNILKELEINNKVLSLRRILDNVIFFEDKIKI